MRSSCSLRAITAAASIGSSRCTPSSTSRPGPAISPTTAPSTRTAARLTRAATALTAPAPAARAAPARAPRAGWRRPAGSAGRSWASASSSHQLPERQQPLAAGQQRSGRGVDLVPPARTAPAGHRGADFRPAVGIRARRRSPAAPTAPPPTARRAARRRRRGAQPVHPVQPALDLRAERLVQLTGQVLEDHGRSALGAAQGEHAEPDRLHPFPVQPVQPGGGLLPGGRSGRVQPRVAQPGADVQRRVGDLALQHPGVDVRRQPGAAPGPASPRRPRAARSRAAGPPRRAPGARPAPAAARPARRPRPARSPGRRSPPAAGPGTNGGLDTIRSNRRPATGASHGPSSSSTSSSLRAKVARAMASARGATSVAVTRAACRPACRACTPHPVPRSSSVPAGRRTVAAASVTEAAPTPVTWSRCWRRASRSDSTHQSAPGSPYGRRSSAAAQPSPSRRSSPAAAASAGGSGASAAATAGSGSTAAEQQQPHQHAQLGAVPAGPQRGLRLTAAERRVRGRAEQVADAVGGVAGPPQRGTQRRRRRRARDGAARGDPRAARSPGARPDRPAGSGHAAAQQADAGVGRVAVPALGGDVHVLNADIGRSAGTLERPLVGAAVGATGERAERHQPGAGGIDQPGLEVVAACGVGDALNIGSPARGPRPRDAASTVPTAVGSSGADRLQLGQRRGRGRGGRCRER